MPSALGYHLSSLPADVARLVLEDACILDRKTLLACCRVSKSVKEWIEPLLYHTVFLTTSSARSFPKTLRKRGDPIFFTRHVKIIACASISGDNNLDNEDVDLILATCRGIQSLIFDFHPSWDRSRVLELINTAPALRQLCPLHVGLLPTHLDFANPGITHFSMETGHNPSAVFESIKGALKGLHGLTHFMLTVGYLHQLLYCEGEWLDVFSQVCATLPVSVQVLVVQYPDIWEDLHAEARLRTCQKDCPSTKIICMRVSREGEGLERAFRPDNALQYPRLDEQGVWDAVDDLARAKHSEFPLFINCEDSRTSTH